MNGPAGSHGPVRRPPWRRAACRAASCCLNVPLPTLSRKILALETALGEPALLLRSTRRLALTDTGAAYHAACKSILEQVAEGGARRRRRLMRRPRAS